MTRCRTLVLPRGATVVLLDQDPQIGFGPPGGAGVWQCVRSQWSVNEPTFKEELTVIQKIALMTGGGDCAGINAFIASAARRAIGAHGLQVIGIRKAFEGACADDPGEFVMPLSTASLEGLEHRPSTILQSSRFNPFSEKNTAAGYPKKLHANLQKLGVDAVLATGGNDTIKSAMNLANLGVPVIAAPKSIDNDVSGTDVMLGFKTAVAFGAIAMRSTAVSARTHRRISLVEIMGRDAGWLALEIGMAGGADVILIPEKRPDLSRVLARIGECYRQQGFCNVAVAEGVRLSSDDPAMAAVLEHCPVTRALFGENLGCDAHGNQKLGGIGQVLRRVVRHHLGLKSIEEVRVTDLGFSLRGLDPVSDDVVLGTRFGLAAIDLLIGGITGQMVALQGTRIATVPFAEALRQRTVDWDDAELARAGVAW